MRRLVALAALWTVTGCGSDDVTPAPPEPEDETCDPAVELTLEDGTCLRPGVPLEACGQGFAHDGAFGCVATLPPAPCPPGQMALPGEATCREVATCPTERWGNVPAEPGTQYVDASFAGPSDGSMASPWTTIGDAVAAVAPGGLVAVEAGTYAEAVGLMGKPVRLHGVCPSEVVVDGANLAAPGCPVTAICALGGSAGSELRGMTIVSASIGVVASDTDLTLREVLVRDGALGGLVIESTLGPATVTVEGSLFEANGEAALRSRGGDLVVVDSVLRDTQPAGLAGGRGIAVTRACDLVGEEVVCVDLHRPQLAVTHSLIERNHAIGISIAGGDAVVTDSLVRETVGGPDGGAGVSAGAVCVATSTQGSVCHPDSRASLQLIGSVVDGNDEIGLYVTGSDATVERSSIRGTRPQANGTEGRNVVVQPPCANLAGLVQCNEAYLSSLVASQSVVEDGYVTGVVGFDANLQLSDMVVARHRARLDNGLLGDGIASLGDLGQTAIRRVLVDDTERAGVVSFGSNVSLAESAIRCAALTLATGDFGGVPATLEDAGGNLCGCPEAAEACKVIAAMLEPPFPAE